MRLTMTLEFGDNLKRDSEKGDWCETLAFLGFSFFGMNMIKADKR